MPRFSAGVRTATTLPTTTLPAMSLYAAAAVGARVTEVGVFNTTTTAVAVSLARLTTAGTQGAGLVEAKFDPASAAAACTAVGTHTVAPTATDLGYRAALGAAIGAGVIWTFGDGGLIIPVGTGQGIGVLIATGTGQHLDVYFCWDE